MSWEGGAHPGWWMVRCCRDCPMVPARVYWCDHEPDIEDNKVDQPYLQGQLGLELHDPADIWLMLEFCESTPEQQRLLAEPPLSARDPRGQRDRGFVTAPMAKWKQDRARRITAEEHAYQIADLAWAKEHAPDEPKASPHKRIDLMQAQLPF